MHPRKDRLEAEIRRLTDEAGIKHYISVMALGAGTWAAEAVLQVQNKGPTIALECSIPHEKQAAHWRERDHKGMGQGQPEGQISRGRMIHRR